MNNKPHFCPEWDYMLITPNAPEMDSCICHSDGPTIHSGAEVKTAFYAKDSQKIRIVKNCYPAPVNSQSGWFIQTTDGLACDAGWFSEC